MKILVDIPIGNAVIYEPHVVIYEPHVVQSILNENLSKWKALNDLSFQVSCAIYCEEDCGHASSRKDCRLCPAANIDTSEEKLEGA